MAANVSKKKRKRRRKQPPPESVDPGLMAAYLSDPIALWQDGQYEALEALYASDCCPDPDVTKHVDPDADDARDIPF